MDFRSGMSGSVNGKRAVAECFDIAFDGAPEQDCDLIVFHTTVGHDFETLLAEMHRLAPSARVIGCTCAGVIGKEGANETLKGLAMMFVRGPAASFAVAHSSNINGRSSYEEAKKMAESLKASAEGVHTVYLLASGIDIAADQAIRGFEEVLGEHVRVVGGTSSDNMQAKSTYQFLDQQVFERGAVAVGIADPELELVQGVHHGSVPVGQPFKVTKVEGNRVYELNGEPAWPALMNALGKDPQSHPGPMIPIAGVGVELSESLKEQYDNPQILRVIAKTEGDGSFYVPVDLEEGTELRLMERNEELIFAGLERMTSRTRERLGGRVPVAVLHTDCAARGRALFGRIMKDEIVARMQHPVTGGESVPWLGMYGFGEFTELDGKNHFHNYTTSLYCLVRKG